MSSQTTITYANASGASVTLEATTGTVATIANNRITDGSAHYLPTGDAVARQIYVQPTDGTNKIVVAQPNAALAENAATWMETASLVCALDPNASAGSQAVQAYVESTSHPNLRVAVYNGSTEMPAMAAVGTAGFVSVTDGTNKAAVKAASTAALATDPSLVVAVSPNQSPWAVLSSGVSTAALPRT